MARKTLGILLIVCLSIYAKSQPSERLISPEEYIEMYKDDAIKEMLISGVPASITLAQGMLESGNGNSPLAKYANNHFGIKCHNTWDGPTFIQDDDEKNECFRKYYSVYNSYKDHSEFLRTRSRYSFLFDLKTHDYKGWAHGLKKAGYATNPKYAHLLINIIEKYELHNYDKIKKMPELTAEAKADKKIERTAMSTSVKVHENNIKYVLVKKGDTFYKIASENEMGLWQILKYNDYEKGDILKEGSILYLQPKRRKSKKEYHICNGTESIHDISQMYGVKLKSIYKYNGISPKHKPKKGEKIYLKRH